MDNDTVIIPTLENSEPCYKCGGCCRTMCIWLHLFTYEDLRWHMIRGATIVVAPDERMLGVEYAIPCPYLSDIDECKIYDQRPEVCKIKPGMSLSLCGCQMRGNLYRIYSLDELEQVQKEVGKCVGEQSLEQSGQSLQA